MMPYNIEQTFLHEDYAKVFLLNSANNFRHINHSIIPRKQYHDIQAYKAQYDINKRLLARSFLFEYLKQKNELNNFEFVYNQYQKPYLKHLPNIYFSFSYSEDFTAVGISDDHVIGIDIEYKDAQLDTETLAPEIMNQEELTIFNHLVKTSSNLGNFFFDVFSIKESIMKALGTGLFKNPQEISSLSKQYWSDGQCYKSKTLKALSVVEYSMTICTNDKPTTILKLG